jgi:hypothetical protein
LFKCPLFSNPFTILVTVTTPEKVEPSPEAPQINWLTHVNYHFLAPSNQMDIQPSFGGLQVGTVSFSSAPGARLVQNVSFNLIDDLIALEGVELVTVSLNITGVPRTRIGEPGTTVINILDDDGKLIMNLVYSDHDWDSKKWPFPPHTYRGSSKTSCKPSTVRMFVYNCIKSSVIHMYQLSLILWQSRGQNLLGHMQL